MVFYAFIPEIFTMSSKDKISDKAIVSTLPKKGDFEAWVVNTVKVKMLIKLEGLLEDQGKDNARRLFLVPIFTIDEMVKRVKESAPEMKTFFFKELTKTLNEIGI